jgi:hypothetical protein
MKKSLLILLFLMVLVHNSFGYDVGEIALIEDTDGKIMEVVSMPDQYLARVTCKFYQDHPDIYQAVFVYSNIPLNFMTNVQQGWPVQSISKGIGRELPNGQLYNQTTKFCSKNGVLRQAVKMGDIAKLPDNPDDRYTGIIGYALSGIELQGHEFGHQWLVGIRAKTVEGKYLCAMKGYEPSGEPKQGDCEWNTSIDDYNQHWSYFFNSDASLMYGSRIKDLGNGSFELSYDHPKYSELDQYLMGLRSADEVDPSKLFYVDNGQQNSGSASMPLQPGKTVNITGTKVSFTISDIIRAMGERIPQKEPCHWKGAFIIVYEKDKPPSQATIDKVDTYRKRWETFYAYATDNRGSFDTTLDGRGTGTPGCPGEPVVLDAGYKDTSSEDVIVEDVEDIRDSGYTDTIDTSMDTPVDAIEKDTGSEDIIDIFSPDTIADNYEEDTLISKDVSTDTSEDISVEEDEGLPEDIKRPKNDLSSLNTEDSSGCSCSLVEH